MRSSLVVASLFIAGTAAADPELVIGPSDVAPNADAAYAAYASRHQAGMWLDFGVGVDRVAPGNGGVYQGQFVRFAPQAVLSRHFYVGAELDIGRFDGNAVANDSTAARGTGSVMAPSGVTGTTGAAMALVGARATAGIVSGGVELAGGVRIDSVTNSSMVSTGANGGVIEAHGRLDLFVTPGLSVGGMVGTDLTEKDNMTATLQLSFHTTR
jgi:hypothetical protein